MQLYGWIFAANGYSSDFIVLDGMLQQVLYLVVIQYFRRSIDSEVV